MDRAARRALIAMAASLAIGAVLGLAAVQMLPAPPTVAPPPITASTPPAAPPLPASARAQPPPPVCPPTPVQAERLAQALARRDQVAQRLERHEGPALPWTATMDPALRDADTLVTLVQQVLGDVDVQVDCDEPPCLLSWSSEGGAPAYRRVEAALQAAFPEHAILGRREQAAHETAAVSVVGVVPPELSELEGSTRLRVHRRTIEALRAERSWAELGEGVP